MSNISKFTLSEIVSGIKKKKFKSEEVTESFINNSKKSKKLNTYITECFDQAITLAKKFDKKGDYKGLLSGVPMAVKDLFCTKNVKTVGPEAPLPCNTDTIFEPRMTGTWSSLVSNS